MQALGVPLKEGYPLPSIIITDEADKVRYFGTFMPGMDRSVEDTHRIVAALRHVDSARGGLFTPADWGLGSMLATITNTKDGVLAYYAERHKDKKEGMNKEKDEVASIKTKIGNSFPRLFGGKSPSRKEDNTDLDALGQSEGTPYSVDEWLDSQEGKSGVTGKIEK